MQGDWREREYKRDREREREYERECASERWIKESERRRRREEDKESGTQKEPRHTQKDHSRLSELQ